MRFKSLISSAVLLFAVSGCLSSPFDTDEKRVAVFFRTNEIGKDLNFDNETLQIDEFKFSMDRLNLYVEGDVIIQTSDEVTALIFVYNDQIQGERLILDVNLGFEVNNFSGYRSFLNRLRRGETY